MVQLRIECYVRIIPDIQLCALTETIPDRSLCSHIRTVITARFLKRSEAALTLGSSHIG